MGNKLELFTQLHFNALIEDYRAREQETLKQIELTHQTFYVGVYLSGFLLAATPFILEKNLSILLGAFSLLIYFSALTQIRHMWVVAAHDRYFTDVLVPDIRKLLGNIPNSATSADQLENIMLWKTGYSKYAYLPFVFLPIEHSRIIFPIVTGTLFFVLFLRYACLNIINAGLVLFKNSLFTVIVALNVILFIYVLITICLLYKKYIPSLKRPNDPPLELHR